MVSNRLSHCRLETKKMDKDEAPGAEKGRGEIEDAEDPATIEQGRVRRLGEKAAER